MGELPPHAVLSEQVEESLRGRRLIAAVFLTFRFDPEFFEQEVLPVFLELPLSHASAIKLVQLEDALRLSQLAWLCTTTKTASPHSTDAVGSSSIYAAILAEESAGYA